VKSAGLVIVALAVTLGAGLAACSEERDLGGACEGGACSEGVHPAGFLDPTSDAFHGKELARRSWDFALCGTCHGADFKGGLVTGAVACTDCHADGPTACTTCHGEAGPTSGNHAPHHAAQLACSECHTVPASWDAPGHLLGDTRTLGEAFHIPSDEALTWDQIAGALGTAAGARPHIVHVPSDAIAAVDAEWGAALLGDKAHSMVFDNTKIRRLNPERVAPIHFEQGAREIVAWHDAVAARRGVDTRVDTLMTQLAARFSA